MCGAVFVASASGYLFCAAYFLATCPTAMQPDQGRTVAFQFSRFVVYLTEWEHLLVRLSFWLTFGTVVVALIVKTLLDSDGRLRK